MEPVPHQPQVESAPQFRQLIDDELPNLHALSLREFSDLTAKLARYEQTNERANRAKEIKLPPAPEGKVLDALLCMDVLDGLARVEDESVDLTVTSPPYPLRDVVYPNYSYDGDYEKYLAWLERVFTLVYQKTKNGGECAINCVECSDQTGRSRTSSVRPLLYVPADVYMFMRRIGWRSAASPALLNLFWQGKRDAPVQGGDA